MGSVWLAGHPLGTQKRSDFSPGVLYARRGDFGINGPTNQRSNRSGTTFLTSGFVHDKGRYRQRHTIAISQTSQATIASQTFVLVAAQRERAECQQEFYLPLRRDLELLMSTSCIIRDLHCTGRSCRVMAKAGQGRRVAIKKRVRKVCYRPF